MIFVLVSHVDVLSVPMLDQVYGGNLPATRRHSGGNPPAIRRQRGGKDTSAPAHHLHNQNPSLAALGKKLFWRLGGVPMALGGPWDQKPRPEGPKRSDGDQFGDILIFGSFSTRNIVRLC